MKFTKDHQKQLSITDAELSHLKERYTGIVMYESSQVLLDEWVPCYFGFHDGSKARQMNDMSMAVAEGRARKPMALEF